MLWYIFDLNRISYVMICYVIICNVLSINDVIISDEQEQIPAGDENQKRDFVKDANFMLIFQWSIGTNGLSLHQDTKRTSVT